MKDIPNILQKLDELKKNKNQIKKQEESFIEYQNETLESYHLLWLR
jgi:hypothetical protein